LEPITQTRNRLGIKPTERILAIRLQAQTLQFHRGGALVRAYAVSTGLRPPSNLRHSLGTPRGLHEIAERIGAGQPPGMVFESRVPTGRHFNEFDEEKNRGNLVTTRILWLRGLEPGVNRDGDVDTHSRYIYLHGTNHEERIGQPASAGCILLRNLDIIELYDEVRTGDQVWIGD
jgi:hypothetical protein